MKRLISILLFILFPFYEIFSQGCSMCRGIVESDANSGGTGISSSINSGIIYLFTSTYVLIIIGGLFWYFRSKRYMKDEENKSNIKKRIRSLAK